MENELYEELPSGRQFRGDASAADGMAEAAKQLKRSPKRDDVSFLTLDDRRRQEAREVLAAASAVLGRSLDLRETADAIARSAIPRFADWAVVDVLDENGRLAQLAVAQIDPADLAAAEAVGRSWPPDVEDRPDTHKVLVTGEPVLLGDIHSCVAVPLEAGGERLGVLTLFASEGCRRYTAEDLPLALELGRRAAATLVNARLRARERRAHAEARAARDRTERLQRLSAELTRSLMPDAVVETVVRHLVLALGAQTASVFEFSEADQEFRPLGIAGVGAATCEQDARLSLHKHFPLSDLARTGEPVLIEDSTAWRTAHPDVPLMPGNDVLAWAAFPLRDQEGPHKRLLGALTLTLPGPHSFAEEERGFLQAFADLCAQALDRARLFEAEATVRILAERLALNGALADVRTHDEIAQAVSREAREALGASVAGLGLLAEDGRTFTMKSLEGVVDAVREAWRTFPNTPAVPYGVVVAERAPLFFSSRAAYSARFPDLEPALAAGGFEATAVLPLITGDGRALGAVHFDFFAPRAFDRSARQAFASIAQQCTAALERVQMYEAERARAAAEVARLKAEAAQAVAEAASRAKDELLAFVSHELRAPLAPARALAQVLTRADTLAPELREIAAEIERHIAVEARLVENLLEFERAGRGLLTVRCGRCDLRDVVRRALRDASPTLQDKQIDVEEGYPDDEAVAWADPHRVQQIVDNLLTNAAKFSPHDTGVVVRAHNSAPGWVELTVTDAGYGIAPDDLPRLFTPFTQLGGVESHYAGLGLGLALSRRLTELQGGTLTAASEGRGRGATFTLRLPTAPADVAPAMEPDAGVATTIAPEADASELAAPETRGPEVVGGDDGRTLRILVIEDDRGTALALSRLLSVYGHEVHLAESLATAEQIACTEGLDVLLSDLGLREESGLEAPRRVSEAARRCGRAAPPAVALTGFSRESDLAQTRAAGFVAHLVKPVSEQALLRGLRLAGAKR